MEGETRVDNIPTISVIEYARALASSPLQIGVNPMNGVVRIDLANFITVGLIAFLFIFVANYGLRKAGLDAFTV